MKLEGDGMGAYGRDGRKMGVDIIMFHGKIKKIILD